MSNISEAVSTSNDLVLTASEEAARSGLQTTDIDHLLIALVVDEQSAGQVLRSLGITLDSVRTAVAEQHTEQLSTLGVSPIALQPNDTVLPTGYDNELTERVSSILKRAAAQGQRGYALAVLEELVIEPSGLIAAILQRLDTTPQQVSARLESADQHPASRSEITIGPGTLTGTAESFAPASPASVWEMLADPSRISQWQPSYNLIEDAPGTIKVGDAWRIRTAELADDQAKPPSADLVEARVEVTDLEAETLIEWRYSYPHSPRANARVVRIELAPADGGTRLRLALAWERQSRPRRPWLFRLLRPAYRFILTSQLKQLGRNTSRAFR